MSSVATVPATTDKLQRCLSLPPDNSEESKVEDTLIRILHARNEAKTEVKLSKKGFSFDNAKEYSKQGVMKSNELNLADKANSSDDDENKVKPKKKKKRRASLARPLNLHGIKAFSLDKSDGKAAWNEPNPERTKRDHILKRAFRRTTKSAIIEETTELKPAHSLSSLVDVENKNCPKKQSDNCDSGKMKQVHDLSSINVVDKSKLDIGFFDKLTKSPFISRKKQPISVHVIPSSTPVSPSEETASVPSSPYSEHLEHLNSDYHKSLSSWITGSVTLPRRFRNKKQRPVLIESPSSTESSIKSSPKLGVKENSSSQNSLVETILGKNITTEDILNDNYFSSELTTNVYWNEYGSNETMSSGDIPNPKLVRQSPVSDFESINVYDQGYVTWDGRGGSTLPRQWKTNKRKENVSDSRENLREPAWINNVKNRVKKSSNAQKPQNMLINKLPNYTSSLPNSSFASLQGQSKTLSTMELAQKLNNDGNSSETSEKRLSGYADDESISYQSGMYTPPNSSTQLSSMRENSSSAEHLGDLQYYSELKKDPDLSLGNDNPETWSMTVDKKLLKKMNKKDMKRQENIYEFFQKEQNFLTTLKIMQKIFAQGMRLEANIDDTVISTMFPQIDEFVEYTNQFMVKLRQRQEKRDDKVVDEIGDLLVEQWSGESARQMIDLFSQICCEQNEIVALYKDLLKSDKKFNDFIETSRKNPLTRRRGIQECLLLVTQRITKYQIMVKSLIDNSSDKKYKKDVENLQKALECVTGITVAVNSRVQEHEKLQMLKKIWKSMESKVITYNETRKFSKDDLLQQMRHLEHYAHNIQWKSKDSKKIVDVTMLLFTDCLVLLHESNQRYSFASNGQPAVVPLHKLIVRDIANEQQGFYLISAGSQVEMYTLYCDSEESCKNWMQYIRTAAQNCPEEDEGIQTEEERKQEQKWIEAHAMINELEVRDKKINALLEEKMENFRKLAALSNKAGLLENMQFRYPTHSWVTNDLVPPGTPVLLQAIDQVAKLTHAIHGPGGVARHPSSVGEGESGSYTPPVLPKRSGTFGGFDNGAKELQSSPKLKVLPKDFEKESFKESRKRDSGLIMTDFTVGSPDMNENELEEKVTEPPGGKLPLLDHQVTSLAQLTHLLNQYLSIATQQDTQMEIIKLELEQAKDKPHSRRRQTSNLQEVEALRYKSKQQQQEQELSKQQTQLMMDKMAWNKEIEQRKNTLDVTENEVNERITTVKKREEELEKEQEEVKKMKDDLQREMARLRELQKRTQNQEQGISTHTSVPTINHNNSNNQDHDIYRHSSDVSSDKIYKNDFKSTSPTYNSASDYPRTFPVGKRESGVIFPPHNTIGGTSTSSLFPQQQNLPIHLQYSATNQATALQHTNTQIPGKLSKLAKKSSAPNSVSNIHQVIPNKLSGLSKSGGVNASKPGHNSKFADGIKHKIPFGHSKHQSKTDDSSYLKHSKSETNVGNRLRPTSAYDSSTTEVDSSAVERSNSASSNSSKEGSEKKKKKHSSNESDKSRSKETKEVFYL